MSRRKRADALLVEKGMADSAADARSRIMAGRVLAGGRRVEKAGELLPADADVRLKPGRRFVSRGGLKLEGALESLGLDVNGLVVLDAGASTGGFTHCLLARGARRVYSVDVGYGQLAWELRGDPRVEVMERTNVRSLEPGRLLPPPQLAVVDLSFLSLTTILGHISTLLTGEGRVLALVKPQFEVSRGELEGGVVVSEESRGRAVARVEAAAAAAGLKAVGALESPLRGADGNREYFLYLAKGTSP